MSDNSLTFDLLARDRASDKFQKIGKAAGDTGSKIGKLGKLAKVGMLGLAGATVGAVGALGLMVKSAIDDQKSQSKLAQTLKNTTGATKTQIASVEDWISAQGRAYGVVDDDLRPALDKLSVATGSITKAQQLASLAMNVSAGTGKDLQSVSMALAKAYNGNTQGLGRLGIAVKDAQGKTKTFAQIQDDLAKKFKGQAATAADTFAGRVKRFKVAISEAGESIGYSLLPLLSRMAGFIVNKAIPAIGKGADKVSDFFSKIRRSKGVQDTFDKIRDSASNVGDGFAKAKRALDKIKETVGSIDLNNLDGSKIGKALGDAVLSGLQRLGALAGKIGDTLGSMFAKVDWVGLGIAIGAQAPALVLGLVAGILNFDVGSLFRGIMAHWQVILIAALTVAFAPTKFAGVLEKILTKIPFAGKFLAAMVRWMNELGGKLKSFGSDLVKTFWRGFTSTQIPGVAFVARVLRAVASLPLRLGKFWADIQLRMGVWALDAAEGAGRGLRSGIGKVISFMKTVPGKIVHALGNLGGLLTHAGEQIIESLLGPLRAGAEKVKGVLKGITDKIPDWKGPADKDKVLLTPAGIAIMEGLLAGLKKRYNPVKDFLQKITDKVQATGEKLKGLLDTRNQFAAGFQSFASSIFGRDTGTDANGAAIPETVAGIKAFQVAQQRQAAQLASNVKRLVGLGLSKSLLTQLQSQGSSGIAQINTLAANASAADIRQLNNSDRATAANLNAAGMTTANAIYGSQISQARRDDNTAKAIAKAVREELHGALDGKLMAEIHGDQLVLVIRRDLKKKGKRDPFS